MPARVLVVDDNRSIADTLCMILRSAGHEAVAAYSAMEAMLHVANRWPQIVIADVIMPEKTGIDLAAELRGTVPEMPIVLLSGNAETEELLKKAGVALDGVLVLAKPVPPRDLLRIVGEISVKLAA